MSETLSGGDMLIRALQDAGVSYVFGYPGGAALHIYDAIFRQQKVEHILVRHEQAATHMADGYARSTGKPGVVLVTSGPGATNAITGQLGTNEIRQAARNRWLHLRQQSTDALGFLRTKRSITLLDLGDATAVDSNLASQLGLGHSQTRANNS